MLIYDIFTKHMKVFLNITVHNIEIARILPHSDFRRSKKNCRFWFQEKGFDSRVKYKLEIDLCTWRDGHVQENDIRTQWAQI